MNKLLLPADETCLRLFLWGRLGVEINDVGGFNARIDTLYARIRLANARVHTVNARLRTVSARIQEGNARVCTAYARVRQVN
ncbi:hypothetical protein, partial [Sporosarcina sp. NCCP-2222]|uniref:hypothetical protein n=1 Tax=Sporosarcina sp. NCCP-2222 TaxID=2935073 RepID=UPI0020BD6AC6